MPKIEEFLPDKDKELCEEHIRMFFKTMTVRQNIWWKRYKGKSRPWTKNEILSKYRFCNAYRELDKHSQWLINNIIKSNDSLKDKVWKICVFRLFNNIETFEIIDIPTHGDYNAKMFNKWVGEVEKHFVSTNPKAYSINTWLAKGMTQGMMCSSKIMPSLHSKVEDVMFHGFVSRNDKVGSLINSLRSIEGIGKFLSHEFFIDMCYLDVYNKDKSGFNFNQDSYTNIGPGAQVGLRLLTPAKHKTIKTARFIQDMSKEYLDELGFKYIKWDVDKKKYIRTDWNVTLTNIEFWLCEYQKYFKMRHGVGKQRIEY